jgi:hypothetical protein
MAIGWAVGDGKGILGLLLLMMDGALKSLRERSPPSD